MLPMDTCAPALALRSVPGVIELNDLTKRFGSVTAVDDLTLEIKPGLVTGFLGPNGAGKSTTMRLILGLDAPTAGQARIDGRRYADLSHPLHTIGALLDAQAVHPARSGRDHLRAMARSHGISDRRVDEVIQLTGMTSASRRRAGGYSLGMSQRLGIAGALLGDPQVLMLDEPVNGLDPDGVLWIRTLLRSLAAEGRTVFVSSHLMSEMERTADRLVVLGRGRLIADQAMAEFVARSERRVVVRGPELAPLTDVYDGATWTGAAELTIPGVAPEQVGSRAFALSVEVHGLAAATDSLEHVYMSLTADQREYRSNSSEQV